MSTALTVPERHRLSKEVLLSRARVGATVASVGVGLIGGLAFGPWFGLLALATWPAVFIGTGKAIVWKRKMEDRQDALMQQRIDLLENHTENAADAVRSITLVSEKRVETAKKLQARVVKVITAYDALKTKADDEERDRITNLALEARLTCEEIIRLLAKVRDEDGGGSYWIDDLSGHIPIALKVMEEFLALDRDARNARMVEKVVSALRECRYAVAHKRDVVSESERNRIEDTIKALVHHRIPDEQKDAALWKAVTNQEENLTATGATQ